MKTSPSTFKLKPKTKEDLENLIKAELAQGGNGCDLNHIDTSIITDFSFLFLGSLFCGDISRWDVSNVESMIWMFTKSEFNGDISAWNASSLMADADMFLYSKMAKVLNVESPSFEQVKRHFLGLRLEENLQAVSSRQGQASKVRL